MFLLLPKMPQNMPTLQKWSKVIKKPETLWKRLAHILAHFITF
jgi:hypothetical protein